MNNVSQEDDARARTPTNTHTFARTRTPTHTRTRTSASAYTYTYIQHVFGLHGVGHRDRERLVPVALPVREQRYRQRVATAIARSLRLLLLLDAHQVETRYGMCRRQIAVSPAPGTLYVDAMQGSRERRFHCRACSFRGAHR